jgi:hypothetical protein
VKVKLHVLLNFAVYGGQYSASHPGHFIQEKELLVLTGRDGGWAELRGQVVQPVA